MEEREEREEERGMTAEWTETECLRKFKMSFMSEARRMFSCLFFPLAMVWRVREAEMQEIRKSLYICSDFNFSQATLIKSAI